MNHNNFGKSVSDEEEVRLEGVLKLLPCQEEIKRIPSDDIDVRCICEKTGICFSDMIYLSKYVITETCKKHCPNLKD